MVAWHTASNSREASAASLCLCALWVFLVHVFVCEQVEDSPYGGMAYCEQFPRGIGSKLVPVCLMGVPCTCVCV
jgi:hypothetical protein